MSERLFNKQVDRMTCYLEEVRGVPMGISDRLLFRKLARDTVKWLSGDQTLSPEEVILDGVTIAMDEFPEKFR
ncbi:hypothetical protein JXA63_03635 [Candidatus Woesebacteria bacterium]|nr:hypothetical protein [Candidatus Woesebacteria bacterium]